MKELRPPTEKEAQEVLSMAREWNSDPRIRSRFNSMNCVYPVAEYLANQRGFTLWPTDLKRSDR